MNGFNSGLAEMILNAMGGAGAYAAPQGAMGTFADIGIAAAPMAANILTPAMIAASDYAQTRRNDKAIQEQRNFTKDMRNIAQTPAAFTPAPVTAPAPNNNVKVAKSVQTPVKSASWAKQKKAQEENRGLSSFVKAPYFSHTPYAEMNVRPQAQAQAQPEAIQQPWTGVNYNDTYTPPTIDDRFYEILREYGVI